MGTNRITKNIAKIVRAYVSRDQVEMAKAIGCSPGTITALECGNWEPQKGKIFDYYDTIFREIPKDDVAILSSNLGLEKKKIVTPKNVVTKITRKRGRPKIDNTDEFSIRFRGPMAQYLYQACKEELYDGPGDFVRDLIRKHKKEFKSQLAA